MSIGTRDTLYNAAMGKSVKRQPTPPTPAPTPPERLPTATPYTFSPSSAPPSQTLANLLASGTTSYGRSPKGKYSGFYSGADLDAAITGSAINLRQNVPTALESKAGARYAAMNQMYRRAIGTQVPFTTEYDPRVMSAGNFRIAEQLASNPQLKQTRRNIAEYMQPLGSWYSEQAKPAEEYLAAASQIRTTPISELATNIATQQYGMNPNLAVGKFSGLDATYFERERDADYMRRFGRPYEQYRFEQEEPMRVERLETQQTEKQIAEALETETGLSTSRLASTTGQSPSQMYDALSSEFTVDGGRYNGMAAVREVKSLIDRGDTQGAADLVRVFQSTPGAQDISLLLNALIKFYITRPANMEVDLEEIGL